MEDDKIYINRACPTNCKGINPVIGVMDSLKDVIDAAVALTSFCKTHDYPEEYSSEYIELTMLLDRQEMALRKAEYFNNEDC